MSERVAGRYRLDDPIGSGGMAEVWRATDTESGATVAVKRLHPGLADDGQARARFRREIEAARSVTNPAAVRIVDADPDAAVPWLAMEHVAGGNLADRLRDGLLPPAAAMRVAADVASALAALHVAGVVHRDVTPSNILLSDGGGARLADFGIARTWEGSGADDVTVTGDLVGTMRFVAPEVLSGGPVTPAADVWALGAVLYEALTGARPFDASSPTALLAAQRTPPSAPPSAGDAAPLLDAMLDPDPARRPSAAEVERRLRPLAGEDAATIIEEGTVAFATAVASRAGASLTPGPAIAVGPEPPPARLTSAAGPPVPQHRRANPAPAVLLAGALLLAATLLGAALEGRQPASVGRGSPLATPVAASPRTAATTTPPPDARGDNGNGKGNGNGNGNGKAHGNGKRNGNGKGD